jgi:hypothetical protein
VDAGIIRVVDERVGDKAEGAGQVVDVTNQASNKGVIGRTEV